MFNKLSYIFNSINNSIKDHYPIIIGVALIIFILSLEIVGGKQVSNCKSSCIPYQFEMIKGNCWCYEGKSSELKKSKND